MQAPRWMAIAWPAFLAAAVMEMLVFAVVDPELLHWQGQALEWSRQGVYSLAFFVFWAVIAAAGAAMALLAVPPRALHARAQPWRSGAGQG